MADDRYEVSESQGTLKNVARTADKIDVPKKQRSAKSDMAKDQPAPVNLYHTLHTAFHQAKTGGIYVPRNVAGTNIPSGHAEGRALDLKLSTHAPGEKIIGDAVFQLVIDSASAWGIDHVIWNRQIWSKDHPHVRPFVGPYIKGGKPILDSKGNKVMKNPHTDHLHIEWTRDGSQIGRLQDISRKIGQLKSDAEDLGVYSDSRGVL